MIVMRVGFALAFFHYFISRSAGDRDFVKLILPCVIGFSVNSDSRTTWEGKLSTALLSTARLGFEAKFQGFPALISQIFDCTSVWWEVELELETKEHAALRSAWNAVNIRAHIFKLAFKWKDNCSHHTRPLKRKVLLFIYNIILN